MSYVGWLRLQKLVKRWSQRGLVYLLCLAHSMDGPMALVRPLLANDVDMWHVSFTALSPGATPSWASDLTTPSYWHMRIEEKRDGLNDLYFNYNIGCNATLCAWETGDEERETALSFDASASLLSIAFNDEVASSFDITFSPRSSLLTLTHLSTPTTFYFSSDTPLSLGRTPTGEQEINSLKSRSLLIQSQAAVTSRANINVEEACTINGPTFLHSGGTMMSNGAVTLQAANLTLQEGTNVSAHTTLQLVGETITLAGILKGNGQAQLTAGTSLIFSPASSLVLIGDLMLSSPKIDLISTQGLSITGDVLLDTQAYPMLNITLDAPFKIEGDYRVNDLNTKGHTFLVNGGALEVSGQSIFNFEFMDFKKGTHVFSKHAAWNVAKRLDTYSLASLNFLENFTLEAGDRISLQGQTYVAKDFSYKTGSLSQNKNALLKVDGNLHYGGKGLTAIFDNAHLQVNGNVTLKGGDVSTSNKALVEVGGDLSFEGKSFSLGSQEFLNVQGNTSIKADNTYISSSTNFKGEVEVKSKHYTQKSSAFHAHKSVTINADNTNLNGKTDILGNLKLAPLNQFYSFVYETSALRANGLITLLHQNI